MMWVEGGFDESKGGSPEEGCGEEEEAGFQSLGAYWEKARTGIPPMKDRLVSSALKRSKVVGGATE